MLTAYWIGASVIGLFVGFGIGIELARLNGSLRSMKDELMMITAPPEDAMDSRLATGLTRMTRTLELGITAIVGKLETIAAQHRQHRG